MKKYPEITFTATMVGRKKLFILMMESFLKNCLDTDLIKKWIIVDDGSSIEDINEISKRFPFLEIHFNGKRGQASAINYLFSNVKTEWIFHSEDDWVFLIQDSFIRKMFQVANTNINIKNVTLRNWIGDDIRGINGIEYNLHEWLPDKPTETFEINNCCWFGYTFNPSLHHMPTFNSLGKCDESHPINSRYWDKDIAIRYMYSGLRVANLTKKYIEHTGIKEWKSKYIH